MKRSYFKYILALLQTLPGSLLLLTIFLPHFHKSAIQAILFYKFRMCTGLHDFPILGH